MAPWPDDVTLVRLPRGGRVRGRRLADPEGCGMPADFALILADGPLPPCAYRRLAWPDFWIPLDETDALDALAESHRRVYRGERVEIACRGGIGRTGTALAALAILDGLEVSSAVTWVRTEYHRRAVETPWQRRWLKKVV